MPKEPLLFLSHRIPYPPNKGDKIRSFNILKALSQHFDVFLGTYIDDPFDWKFVDVLDDYCIQKYVLGQNKTLAKIKGLKAFLTNKSISEPYYHSEAMQYWVTQTLEQNNIRNIFVYSSVMAQFTLNLSAEKYHQIVDFVDVDSDKWRQYSENKSGVAKWIYAREHRKLSAFENKVAKHAHCSLFVSDPEADLFKTQIEESQHSKISGMLNGVDTAYFDPQNVDSKIVPKENEPPLNVVFTGAMDYWANVDAVIWFVEHVWPKIRKERPETGFYIVGGNPSSNIKALNGQNGIVVTGRVDDIRPYILQAEVVVAPLQIARGIQNKVLEALSMSKAVVATSMAIEGIDARTQSIHIVDDPDQMKSSVLSYIDSHHQAPENRQWILDNVQWSATLAKLPDLFEKTP